MRVDILVFHIFKINPLMNLNFMAINFVLDLIMFECPFINKIHLKIEVVSISRVFTVSIMQPSKRTLRLIVF